MNVPHVIGTNFRQRQKSIIAFNSLKFDELQSYKALCFNFITFMSFAQRLFPPLALASPSTHGPRVTSRDFPKWGACLRATTF